MNIYELKDVSHTYNKGARNACTALSNVNLNIEEGDMLAIMGTSGSGKSTLLHILGGIIAPTSGQVLFEGKSLPYKNISKIAEYRNRDIGFVLQNFGLIMADTVLDNVSVPLLVGGISLKDVKERACHALEQVGLEKMKHKKTNQLSGGQKQRVAIARALVNQPRVILADEPTGALDSKTSDEIMEILVNLNSSQGKTIVIVTHDMHIAESCKRRIEIVDGRISQGLRDTE